MADERDWKHFAKMAKENLNTEELKNNNMNKTMKNETKKMTQKELEARALIAGDLMREGEVTRVETFRIGMDAALGENTGDLKFEKNTDFKDDTM
jgi:hypothetical protein